jgi:uncharacterized protein (DUF2235 family)
MAKNIVFCADGTWNGPEDETGYSVIDDDDAHGEIDNSSVTNVVKLFVDLAGQPTPDTAMLKNEQEKVFSDRDTGSAIQVAKYIHGVGDSTNPISKILGGAFGCGILGRIVRGYTFISRNYQPGDAIYIVGFSRGAYTARALGGLIAKVGLLNPASYDPTDKVTAYRLGIAAWAKAKTLCFQGTSRWTAMANAVLQLAQNAFAEQLPTNGLVESVPMKAIGVWDTVGSLGIPMYAADHRYDVFRFIDTALSEAVAYGFHAMAIDERREDFSVTFWDARHGVEQVWFVGAHADIGGGYPADEARLSDEALCWMTSKLVTAGVRLLQLLAYLPTPASAQQAIHEPWNKPPFNLCGQLARAVKLEDTFHASVVEHWRADSAYTFAEQPVLTEQLVDQLTLDAATYAA